ncbi:MAG: hypothetical protein AB3N14_09610 [Flavobacteriaceae bacterium]
MRLTDCLSFFGVKVNPDLVDFSFYGEVIRDEWLGETNYSELETKIRNSLKGRFILPCLYEGDSGMMLMFLYPQKDQIFKLSVHFEKGKNDTVRYIGLTEGVLSQDVNIPFTAYKNFVVEQVAGGDATR